MKYAIVRCVDLVICSEQWVTSRVADRTYSRMKFHLDQLITHELISIGFLSAAATLPQPQKEYRVSHFSCNANFIIINFQQQLM